MAEILTTTAGLLGAVYVVLALGACIIALRA